MMRQQHTPLLIYHGHDDRVNALSWSQDSRYIASASNDSTIQVWDAATGECHRIYRGHREPVEAVAWSPQNAHIASGGWGKMVHVWHAMTGAEVTVYQGHTAWIRKGLAWSPDGTWIASGVWDSSIHVWQALTGDVRSIYRGHESIVTVLSWSPNGAHIASGGGCPIPTVQVWDVSSGKTLARYQEYQLSVRAVVWSPDGNTIAIGGLQEEVRRWDPVADEVMMSYPYWHSSKKGGTFERKDYGIGNVSWSPNGQYLVAATYLGQAGIWHVETGEQVMTFAQSRDVAWSPDGTRIASSYDRIVQVWEAV